MNIQLIVLANNKSYFGYLNNLFDEFNNINDHSTAKKPINDDCSPLPEEVELSCVDDKLKVVNRVSITKCTKYIFSKSYTEK